MAQIDAMVQHMASMTERSRQLSQTLAQMIEQHPEQATDHLTIMQQMCESVAAMAEHMTSNLERAGQLTLDESLIEDREVRKEIEKIRGRTVDMATPMDGVLESLERMTQKVGQASAGD